MLNLESDTVNCSYLVFSFDIELEYLIPGTHQMVGPKLDRQANLSIIDLMMWHGRTGVLQKIRQCAFFNAKTQQEGST